MRVDPVDIVNVTLDVGPLLNEEISVGSYDFYLEGLTAGQLSDLPNSFAEFALSDRHLASDINPICWATCTALVS